MARFVHCNKPVGRVAGDKLLAASELYREQARKLKEADVKPAISGLGRRWGLKNGGRLRGITPRLSGDETRQAVEQHGEDRLIGGKFTDAPPAEGKFETYLHERENAKKPRAVRLSRPQLPMINCYVARRA